MELSQWVEKQGGREAAENIHGALETLDRNEEFIRPTLAVLMTP